MVSLYLKHRKRSSQIDPFIDLLFNCLLGFVFLFLVALLYINPEAKQANIEKKAEYIISATWPELLKDDIDLWVKGPDEQVVSYLKRDAGWLHLDRDDRGVINDTIVINGQETVNPINQEIVTIRKKQYGEYIVNLFFYDSDSKSKGNSSSGQATPVPVDVRIDRVNPKFERIFDESIIMRGVDHEHTVVRFTVRPDGQPEMFNDLPAILTPYKLDHVPLWPN